MLSRVLADAVLVLHLLFIVFAMLGGLLAWYRRAAMFVHLPALAWAAQHGAPRYGLPADLDPLEGWIVSA